MIRILSVTHGDDALPTYVRGVLAREDAESRLQPTAYLDAIVSILADAPLDRFESLDKSFDEQEVQIRSVLDPAGLRATWGLEKKHQMVSLETRTGEA